MLEEASRELFLANQQPSSQSEFLEQMVMDRTAKLRTALERVEAVSAMQPCVIATMSHEIRTPLGRLPGMIDLLYGDAADPARRDLPADAKTSGYASNGWPTTRRNFPRWRPAPFLSRPKRSTCALVDSVMAVAATSVPDGAARLRSSISPTVPRYFAGDAALLRRRCHTHSPALANPVSIAGRYSTEVPVELRAFAFPKRKGG